MAEYILIQGIRVAKSFEPETFGRLTTLGHAFRMPVGKQGHSASKQVCECVCGNITIVHVNSLRTQKAKSCGCLMRETAGRTIAARNTVHGESRKTGEYWSWDGLVGRCVRKSAGNYQNYGGRGIKVCDRWLEPKGQGYLNFLEDMGRKKNPTDSIERIDVNGDYCPENCKWATPKEQGRNQRTNRMLTYKGKTQCLAAWAEELGCSIPLLWGRLDRKWSVERALSTPVGKNKK